MPRFVSNLNLQNPKHVIIPAGNTFDKEDLVLGTFNTLVKQGHIEEVVQGVPNFTQDSGPVGRKVLSTGLDSNTPSGALRKKIVDLDQQSQDEKDRLAAAAKAVGANQVTDADEEALRQQIKTLTGKLPPANCKLPTLIKKLNEANLAAANAKKDDKENRVKGSTDPIWIADPEVIKALPDETLLDSYKQVCEQYDFEQIDYVGKRDELIAQLSADFDPKTE